jgi:hypothetical protein
LNKDGDLLVVWTEGTGWERGGTVHWQVYNGGKEPAGSGEAKNLPVWGLAAAFAEADGSFAVIY